MRLGYLKKNNLSFERIERLNDMGFIWDVLAEQWEEGFSKLQGFNEREGHCWVLQSHEESGFNLGGWVSQQRQNKNKLSQERIIRLDSLCFVWDVNNARWENGFIKLQDYKESKGHCSVPKRYVVEDFKLGGWVAQQRKNKDSLTPERLERLNSLGFVWGLKSD